MNKFKLEKKYLYIGITAFLVIVASLAVFWVLQRWGGVKSSISAINAMLAPITMGVVIAYLLTPVVKVLQSKVTEPFGRLLFKKRTNKIAGFSRGLAVAISLLALVGFLITFLILVIPQLANSIATIVPNISGSIEKAEAWANKWFDDYPQVRATFTALVGDIGSTVSEWAMDKLLPQMNSIVTSVSMGVYSVLKALVNFFIGIVVSIYLLHSREKFAAQAKKILYSIFPPKLSNGVLDVFRFTDKSFMNFFAGQLLDSLIVGVICYIGCIIIGVRYALLISVIIGVTNVIPFFGPFIGAVPSALIILMYSPLQCLIFLLFIVVLQQLDGNILNPKIVGGKTGLSGFWVMFAILVGSGLMGPVGMIIGVPLFTVVYAAIKHFVRFLLQKRGLPVETAVYADLDRIDPETLDVQSGGGGEEKSVKKGEIFEKKK